MQRTSILIFFLLLSHISWSQTNFAGTWEGIITLKNSDNEFDYQLILAQNGNQVTGTSMARLKGGSKIGSFQVAGEINENGELLLKDIEQIKPKDEKWCFKELMLKRSDNQMSIWLGGFWSSKNCDSGLIRLQQKKKPANYNTPKKDIMIGKWTGTLTQNGGQPPLSFELNFQSPNNGTSVIISTNGNQKIHNLIWEFKDGILTFREISEKGKENNKWHWCLKSAQLSLETRNKDYSLKGKWEGYKSRYSLNPNDCPKGTLQLKKK